MRVTTIAMLAGGILGVYLRNLLDGPRTVDAPSRWHPVMISVLGGLVLGALTGAALGSLHGDGPAAALDVGLSGALLTYCVFSSAATEVVKQGPSRQTLVPAIISALSAFAAATAGVTLGVTLMG